MVQKVTPTVYLYNSTHNLYAVLVQRISPMGNKFFFVSANAQAGILPPPYAHRYGNEWDTAAQAQANLPLGFQIVITPESCNMSISTVSAIFQGMTINVFNSPSIASSWTLQISTNGTTFADVKTVTELLPNSAPENGGNALADGEIFYEVQASGLYYFRVVSTPCISNPIAQQLITFDDANSGGGGGGGGGGGETSTAFTTISTGSDMDLGANAPYVYYIDSWGVDGRPRESMTNLLALQGFDYLTISGRYEQQPQFLTESYVQWAQKLVSYPSAVNNIIQEGNQTYYFRPTGYTTDISKNLYDFHLRFPEFTLPSGKIVVIQGAPFSASENAEMTKRGVSYVRKGVPNNQRSFFFGDAWLDFVKDVNDNFMALPPAYTGPEENRQAFYELLDPYQMARQLRDTLNILGILDYGYIMWNYERVLNWDDRVGTWGIVQPRLGDEGKPKRQIFFEEFNRLKPSTLFFAPWTKKPVIIYPEWQSINSGAIWNAVYNGTATTLAQLDAVYVSNNITPRDFPNGINGIAANTIFQTAFYQVGHRTHLDFLYKHVFETYINKRLFPDKKVIGTLWDENEAIPSADSFTQDNIVTFQGQTRTVPFKPAASISYMQSYAAWMTAIGDGFDIWDFNEYEESLAAFNSTSGSPVFPFNNKQNINWAMSAVYALSLNKDIIEASTLWQFPVNPWTAAINEAPLVTWKLNTAGTAALVLAMDTYNEDIGLKTVSVIINGVARTIKIHGKFTSIVRIVL